TKPKNQSIGSSNRILPRNIVNSQLKTLTPVGTAMIMVMMPKKALTFAPAPMVKKWWSQTIKERKAIAMMAQTIEVYPKRRFWEKTGTTSEKIPKAGSTRIYTSG